jgi:hypothetical protein
MMKGTLMINNTSLYRWQRAAARHLDAQFTSTIIQGMNCSPFEAEAIRDAVHDVYAPLMETTETLKPGQIRLSVIAAQVAPNTPLAQAAQLVVTLTLDAGAEDRAVRQQGGVIALRRHRFLRICDEAFQQGGLLTLEAIADLFNCAVRTLVSDFAVVRSAGITPPLRSTVKDMGRAVTHRRLIVEKWLAGLEYTDIARATYHSVSSVANYVEKYKRCATLLASGFDLETVAVIARLSPALAQAFQQLVTVAQPVPHRQEELNALTKKNGLPSPQREVHP